MTDRTMLTARDDLVVVYSVYTLNQTSTDLYKIRTRQ
jgi:hypothetical protein